MAYSFNRGGSTGGGANGVAGPPHAIVLATSLPPPPQSSSAYSILVCTGPLLPLPCHPTPPPPLHQKSRSASELLA